MSAFQSFVDYILIKKHFSDEGFIWIENGFYRRFRPETFEKRKDASFFYRLEKEYKGDRRKIVDFLVSCFIYDINFWVGDFAQDKYVLYHHNRMTRFGALESTFARESEDLEFYFQDKELDLETTLLTTGINDPIIVERFMVATSLETFALLEHFTGFTRRWFPINPLQKWRRQIIYKYAMLLRLEERNMKKLESTYQHLCQI